MKTSRPPGRLDAAMMAPPGRLFHLACTAAVLLSVVSASVPGGFILAFLGAFLGWALLAGVWTLRSVASFWVNWRCHEPLLGLAGSRWRWLVCPALAMMTLVLVASHAPIYPMYWLSRPAMDRVAQQAFQTTTDLSPIRQIGLYPVDSVERIPGGVRFAIRGGGFVNRAGFACFNSGAPAATRRNQYQHRSDNWYRWTEHD